MAKEAKTYWQDVVCDGERSKAACLSWFDPLGDGMTPHKAEMLCDVATERSKKMRVFAKDAEGNEYKLERTFGRKFTVSRTRIDPTTDGVSVETRAGGKPCSES
jgi:hypothetical protein